MAASFDVIESAGYAYKTAWSERRYFWRLALIPVFIKLICHMTVVAYGYQADFIRQALIMLPSYFADGWFVAHAIRYVLYDQRWPFRPTGEKDRDMAILQERARGILTGTVMYVLIRFLLAGMYAVYHQGIDGLDLNTRDGQEPGVQAFLAALMLLVFVIWAFRFLWLYVPAAANVSMRHLIRQMRGFTSSLYLIGAWLIGSLPLLLAFSLVASSLVGTANDGVPPTVEFVISVLWSIIDMMILLITTIAVTYGLRPYLAAKERSRHHDTTA